MTRFPLRFILLATLASFLSAGCAERSAEPSPEEVQQVTDKGKSAADALMVSLGGQLKAALQSGGPVAAMQVCQQAAQPMTVAAGQSLDGISIRRTTLKPRNSVNAPDELDRVILEKMSEEVPPQVVIKWDENVAHYYQPLMIQEVCLKCHGAQDTFPPELTEKLKNLYPDDQATGYALGDFRGVIRVDVDRH